MSEYFKNDESITVRLATQQYGSFDLKMKLCSTGRDIKVSLARCVQEKTGSLPVKELRLLYRGRGIENDEKIGDLAGGKEEFPEILELFAVGQIERSRAYQKVNNFRILMRNVDECITCAKNGTNPRERTRYNHPTCDTPPQPNATYLASLLTEMGSSFTEMSKNLENLSNVLRHDEPASSDEIYEQNRRTVQNNMDAVRYANPMLVNLTKLRIPVNRPLAVVGLTEAPFTPRNTTRQRTTPLMQK